jgi:hypothetical protein
VKAEEWGMEGLSWGKGVQGSRKAAWQRPNKSVHCGHDFANLLLFPALESDRQGK